MQATEELNSQFFRDRELLHKQITADGRRILRWRAGIKIMTTSLLILILVLLCGYAAVLAVKSGNGFPILIDSESGLSLSENAAFGSPTVKLNVPSADGLGNISVSDLPDDIDSAEGGSHNGSDYLAYTFFLKNTSGEEKVYTEEMLLKSVTKGADEAVRVRIYRNGKSTTYARAAADGQPEYGTEIFAGEQSIFSDSICLQPEESVRYTVVIWLEGDDPQCSNDISGGTLRFSMKFSVPDEDTQK